MHCAIVCELAEKLNILLFLASKRPGPQFLDFMRHFSFKCAIKIKLTLTYFRGHSAHAFIA